MSRDAAVDVVKSCPFLSAVYSTGEREDERWKRKQWSGIGGGGDKRAWQCTEPLRQQSGQHGYRNWRKLLQTACNYDRSCSSKRHLNRGARCRQGRKKKDGWRAEAQRQKPAVTKGNPQATVAGNVPESCQAGRAKGPRHHKLGALILAVEDYGIPAPRPS